MPALKLGTLTDFSNSMAESIENIFVQEWATVKNAPLPDQGREDRRMLFVAIAQGVFQFLKANPNVFIDSITLDAGGGLGPVNYTVSALDVTVS